MNSLSTQLTHEWMTSHPVFVSVQTSIGDCARLLNQHGIRHLPLVNANGQLVGQVNSATIFQHGSLLGLHSELWISYKPSEAPQLAGSFCIPVDIEVNANMPLLHTLRALKQSKQDLVVVVDNDRAPIGVITEHDVVIQATRLLGPDPQAHHYATSAPRCVHPNQRAAKARSLMTEHGLRHLLVTENRRLVGVLSYFDLVIDIDPRDAPLRVHEILGLQNPICVQAQTPIVDAAALMVRNTIGALPVLNEVDEPIGVLSRLDVLRAMLDFMAADPPS